MQPQNPRPTAPCPNCGLPVNVGDKACVHCGLSFVPGQAQVWYPVPPKPAASGALIAGMWILTAIAFLLVAEVGSTINALFFDIPSLIIAVVLVTRRADADKINGWIKIGVEVFGCVFSILLQSGRG